MTNISKCYEPLRLNLKGALKIKECIGLQDLAIHKIVTGTAGVDKTATPVTTAELTSALTNLDIMFLNKISSLIKPFYEHLDVIQKNLTETKKVPEGAMSNSLENQSDIQQMQITEDIRAERTIRLDLSQQQNNLKLRRLGGKVEEKGDLTTHVSNWLLQQIGVEGDISPVITKAFRL
ncbi:UNVERIFIED_CONTAM: hypothetical protein K2H54_010995 [Gekko kuhli]